MSIRCDICAEWSPGAGFGHRDICLPCFERNFSGNPLEAMDDDVDAAAPYQHAALARLSPSWPWADTQDDGHA